MTRSRVDANQPELVKLWRRLGGTWQHTHEIPGALDGIAGMAGVDVRVEIKDGSKPPSARYLTDAEAVVFEMWKGRAPIVWSCQDDVLRTAKALRASHDN